MGNKNSGFIRTLLIIVIALVILAYFGYDVREYIDIQKALGFMVDIWNNYILVLFENIKDLFS